MNAGAYVTELEKLGYKYVGRERLLRFVGWAARRVVTAEPYAFRFVSVDLTSSSGVLIVDDVTYQGRRLPNTPLSELFDRGVQMGESGEPRGWYEDRGQVKVWPAGTAGVQVHGWSGFCWLNDATVAGFPADEDATPTFPQDLEDLVLMEARLHCLEDNDETRLRDSISERIVAEKSRVLDLLKTINADEPGQIEQRGGDFA